MEWYLECLGVHITLPGDLDAKGNAKNLTISEFAQEPQWPQMIMLPDTGPLVPYFWHAPRVHHLLQPDLLPQAQEAVSEGEVRDWLSEQMFMDFEGHSELIGSLHLIAPNPILRGVAHGLVTSDPKQEASALR